MALVNCPECGKEFSDKAQACPNCACPISEIAAATNSVTTKKLVKDYIIGAAKAINPGVIKAAERLTESEGVLFAIYVNAAVTPNADGLQTNYSTKGKQAGILAITEKKILFVSRVMMNEITKEILVKDIQSIDAKKSLLNCPIRIKGITDMIIVDCNSKQHDRIMATINLVRK